MPEKGRRPQRPSSSSRASAARRGTPARSADDSNASRARQLDERKQPDPEPEGGGLSQFNPAALSSLLGTPEEDQRNWWQRNVSGPVGEFENWLQGSSSVGSGSESGQDDGEKRGGYVLTWDGNGGEIDAPEGAGDCETIDITDIMTAFGAMSRSLKAPQATLLGTDSQSWFKAAKSWKKLLLLVFVKIPAAADLAVEDLKALGMSDEALEGFVEARAEFRQSAEGAPSEPSADASGEDTRDIGDDLTSPGVPVSDDEVIEETELVEVPGWAMVRTDSGSIQAVLDWRLPVSQSTSQVVIPGSPLAVRVLREGYADGQERLYGWVNNRYVPARSLGLGDTLPDQEWSDPQTRMRYPDGAWAGEGGKGWVMRRARP